MKTLINQEAEQQILSGMLKRPATIIAKVKSEMLTVDHFADFRCKQLFTIIMDMAETGRELHIKDISRQPEIAALNDAVLVMDISEIRSKFAGAEAWTSYLPSIKKAYALREAYKATEETIGMIETGENPHTVASHLSGAAQRISMITESSTSWKTSEQSTREFLEMMRKIHSKEEEYGYPSGIPEIDLETGGLMPEDFWVTAAPSSCGKTMLMMQIINNYHSEGKNVLIFSFETSAAKLISRMVAARTGINSKTILGKGEEKLCKADMHKIKRETEKIMASDTIVICDQYDLTLESLMGIASKMRESGKPLDLIMIDYIQIVKVQNKEGRNREQDIAYITSNFKAMAKEHHCPVISASQLNRQGAVRESDAILQDADVLLKIDPERGCIYLAKNRDGEKGLELPLVMMGRDQKFIFNRYFQQDNQ
jgi:replicative DNA helicase